MSLPASFSCERSENEILERSEIFSSAVFLTRPFEKSSAPSGRLSATLPKKMPFDLTRREGRRGLLSDPLTSFPLEDSEKRKFDWIIAEFQHSGLTGPNHGSNSTKARGSFQNHERRNCATYGHSIFAHIGKHFVPSEMRCNPWILCLPTRYQPFVCI
jgi:hypothetical protein